MALIEKDNNIVKLVLSLFLSTYVCVENDKLIFIWQSIYKNR